MDQQLVDVYVPQLNIWAQIPYWSGMDIGDLCCEVIDKVYKEGKHSFSGDDQFTMYNHSHLGDRVLQPPPRRDYGIPDDCGVVQSERYMMWRLSLIHI